MMKDLPIVAYDNMVNFFFLLLFSLLFYVSVVVQNNLFLKVLEHSKDVNLYYYYMLCIHNIIYCSLIPLRLHVSFTLCLLVFALNLEGRYYYAHFINEKTEPETRLQAGEIHHLHSAS